MLSHSLQSRGTSELFEYLIKQEIRRQEKKHGMTESRETTEKSEMLSISIAAPVRNETNRSRKTVSRSVQRNVWRKANGRCEYPGCGSRYRLEIDHITPLAQGGDDTIDNLRLYCRTHNFGHAVENFGIEKMNSYRRV